MNHKGHENEESDRKPKKLLIVKQILLVPILEKCPDYILEKLYSDVKV